MCVKRAVARLSIHAEFAVFFLLGEKMENKASDFQKTKTNQPTKSMNRKRMFS